MAKALQRRVGLQSNFPLSCLSHKLRIVEQAAGHLRWEVDYPPSQPVGSGFEPHWRPQTAKLPSFGGYSLETLPYLTYASCTSRAAGASIMKHQWQVVMDRGADLLAQASACCA